MTQVWDEPEEHVSSDGTHNMFPKHSGWMNVLKGHMESRGFWLPDAKDIKWGYNYGYHFFDIDVYERYPCGFGQGNPRDGIETMRRYLEAQGLRNSEHDCSRVVKDGELELPTRVNGVRFWVYPTKLWGEQK